ncbi:MAG: hypothetical protein KDD67_03425 [Ignavibacteriae bacterium]|nr:hypothetical protein [Ignavibacteriota bacterium]MCB9217120.1 hypothetical protein [Ignavibacteria bacterium]
MRILWAILLTITDDSVMNQSHMVIRTNKESLWGTGRSTLLLTLALFSLSCNSSDIATRNESGMASSPLSDSSDSFTPADSAEFAIVDVVTGPETAPTPVGLTLGEQLKQLDERMKVAPADSLEILMIEYDRLLDSAITGKTSPEPVSTPTSTETVAVNATAPVEKTETPTEIEEEDPYSSFETITSDEASPVETSTDEASPVETSTETPSTTTPTEDRNYAVSTPRTEVVAEQSNQVLVQSTFESEYESSTFDPSKYRGARASELKYYNETKSATTNRSGTTTTLSKKGKSSRPTSRSKTTATPSTTAITPKSSRSRAPERSPSETLDEKYSNGLTFFRAGSYSKAIVNLQPVVSSSKSYRNTARFYYGLALERTGALSQAASQFRKLKGGSGSLADKAWIAYARTLQRQGQSGQAKKELLSFIKARPNSGQIGSARELLQKL